MRIEMQSLVSRIDKLKMEEESWESKELERLRWSVEQLIPASDWLTLINTDFSLVEIYQY